MLCYCFKMWPRPSAAGPVTESLDRQRGATGDWVKLLQQLSSCCSSLRPACYGRRRVRPQCRVAVHCAERRAASSCCMQGARTVVLVQMRARAIRARTSPVNGQANADIRSEWRSSRQTQSMGMYDLLL